MNDTTLQALASRVGEALSARGIFLATAESCTGGWIAKTVTDIPGSSCWFDCGFIVYNRNAKQSMLGVPAAIIDANGEVSEPTVRALAEGALARSRAAMVVAVSGIAGPSGGTPDKPLGTVCFAWGLADMVAGAVRNIDVSSETRHFDGDREAVRRQSVQHALEGVLKLLET
ncbi:MAG: CinA family protein [Granulosicoccaceae bacterium]|jgi:nicotinamide-nucleotide amidase